jgi:hypothetical protein
VTREEYREFFCSEKTCREIIETVCINREKKLKRRGLIPAFPDGFVVLLASRASKQAYNAFDRGADIHRAIELSKVAMLDFLEQEIGQAEASLPRMQ